MNLPDIFGSCYLIEFKMLPISGLFRSCVLVDRYWIHASKLLMVNCHH